jgi:nicotinamidase-related amidase
MGSLPAGAEYPQIPNSISVGTVLLEKCKLTSAVIGGAIVANLREMKTSKGLVNPQDSILIGIDVQTAFARKLRPVDAQGIAVRIGWLIGAARWLDIPVVMTAEDLPRLGGPMEEVAQWLPAGTLAHNKMVFDLTEEPDIVKAVRDTGRRCAVLVGFETDVCVAQSAIGMIRLGHRVVVLADCCGSPGSAHAAGLQRMAAEGVLIRPLRSLLYEWLRTVERSQRFREEFVSRHPLPEGLIM